MSKKKKRKKELKRALAASMTSEEKVMRLAHHILTKTIEPADLKLEEAVDVLAIVAKAIVIANTSDDDPEERAGMIDWIEEHFIEVLEELNPDAEHDHAHLHAWLVAPQGLISEPVGFLWAHDAEEGVRVVVGAELAAFRAEIADGADELHEVVVVEGVEGIAMTDPEWDGEPTFTCANPHCGKVHDVHLVCAENLFQQFQQAKQRAALAPAPN